MIKFHGNAPFLFYRSNHDLHSSLVRVRQEVIKFHASNIIQVFANKIRFIASLVSFYKHDLRRLKGFFQNLTG